MVKRNKLLRKILSGSKNIRFAEFTRLLESFGFSLDRISGSHHIYSHPNLTQSISVQPDKNGQAKSYQIKEFLVLIEKFNIPTQSDSPESTDETSDVENSE